MLNNVAFVQGPWHRGGLFMAGGMHWVWWLILLATLAVVAWALWRAVAERREARRQTLRNLRAEEILRERFVCGEISEEEFASQLQVLHGSGVRAKA